MKIALILSGLHYNKELNIDFRYYVRNIKQYLFNLGEIDIYFITKYSNDVIIKELRAFYNIKELCFMEDTLNRRISKTIRGLELINDSGIIYDYVCITRPDIYFCKPFSLNYSFLNIFSQLETTKSFDDNFYFFPFSYLPQMIDTYSTLKNIDSPSSAHDLRFNSPIHFICNEHKSVPELSSFKLRFFKKTFSLNYLYTPNITYYYNDYSIGIFDKQIIVSKGVSSVRAGFSLFFEGVGTYKVIHSYTSNSAIYKYLFINNKKYGNNDTFQLLKPTIIHFIFDMNEAIHIVFNSIQFVKQNNLLFKIK